MKRYIHSRLGAEESAMLTELKQTTGDSDSQLVRKALRLIYEREVGSNVSALDVAGKSVGKFCGGPRDLSTNRKHLEGFGR